MKPRTVLIGLDGATFTLLDGMMGDRTMPFLKRLVDSGVRAALRSVIPALTPPAWTSLTTGRSPGQHGIFNFFGQESPASHHIRLLTSHDVGCETIWSIANRAGLCATVLNFPLTFPAPAIDGYVVAGGWMPWRQLRLGCYPAGLYDRLKALPGFNPRELAMDMAHEAKALEGCRQDEYEEWIALHIRRERQWFDVLSHLMTEDPSDLTAILFDGVDKLQHLCWRFLDPAYAHTLEADWESRIRERCLDYFRELDVLLAKIVELAGPEATVVIASDHGFGSQVRTLFINTWLEQNGYLAWAGGTGPRPSETGRLGMDQIARHVYLLDWSRTKAYASMPGGNGIHIVRSNAAAGVRDDEYESLRDEILTRLSELRDPTSGEPVVARAWRREEVFAGPHLDLAPDLTLELEDGGLMSILAAETAVVPLAQPTGTHRPDGVFIASGPALRRGVALPRLSILDVAPLLLYSLGLAIPADLEGRVPEMALEPAALQAHPVRWTGAAAAPRPAPAVEQVFDEQEEQEVLSRLRALGYVE